MRNLALIGCGDVATRTYIPGIQAVAGQATVTATFDPVAERARHAASLFPSATAYTSLDALLGHPNLDGVFNLTPAPLHRDISRQALDAGLHVFSEKPIAASVADANALIAHAEQLDKLLLCAPAVMAMGRFQWLSKVIADGRIGRLNLAAAQMANMGPAGWRAYTGDPAVFYSKDVGPMLDLGVYVLHAITGLFGPVKRVQAFGGIAIPQRDVLIERLAGKTITVEANDIIMMHLDFGENRFAQILASFAVPSTRVPALEIHGSEGTISIPFGAWYDAWGPVDLYRRDNSLLGLDGWTQNGPPNRPEGIGHVHLIHAGPKHFVDCLNGAEPILTAAHATHVLEIMQKATQSTRDGTALTLETTFSPPSNAPG